MSEQIVAQLSVEYKTSKLHLNRRIPCLHLSHPAHIGLQRFDIAMIHSTPIARLNVAKRLARRNLGISPIEMGEPVKSYLRLINSFSDIEGLVGLWQENLYTLEFEVGKLFNPICIGERISIILARVIFSLPILYTVTLAEYRDQTQSKISGGARISQSTDLTTGIDELS
jgi:hypothetical protein